MVAETYEGLPCRKGGHTTRYRRDRHCVVCAADHVVGQRENSITYFTTLLKNRRRAALKRQEARNG